MTINEYCEKVLLKYPSSIEDHKRGKAVLGFLVGQVMIDCRGSENPKFVRTAMEEILNEKVK